VGAYYRNKGMDEWGENDNLRKRYAKKGIAMKVLIPIQINHENLLLLNPHNNKMQI